MDRMDSGDDSDRGKAADDRLRSWARGFAALGGILGVASLVGWVLRIPILTTVTPGFTAMAVNTALCLVLLWISVDAEARRAPAPWVWLPALVAAAVGALTLVQEAIGLGLGIDPALLEDARTVSRSARSGRMAPTTAACLVLLGVSMIASRGSKPLDRAGQAMALAAALTGHLALLGYAYGFKELYEVRGFTAMAVNTAAAVAALGVAALLARGAEGWLWVVAAPGPGGNMARRLLPATILVPLAAGAAVTASAQQDLSSVAVRMAVLATTHTLVFGALVLVATATAERLDVRRRSAEADRQRLADVVETTTDLVAITGPDARLVYLNRAGRRMAGIPDDEDVIGLPLAALLSPAAAELVARTVVPALVEGGSWRGDSALLPRGGREVPVSVVASGHRRDGSVAWMAAVMRDVSAEKRAQEDLAGERTMLEGLLLSAPVGLGFVDRSFRFVRINDALARYGGRSAADHLGRSVSEMVPHLWPLLEPIFRRVLEVGETLRDVPVSDEAVARPGEAVHTSCSYYPVRDAGGGISGVGIVVADVTDRVRAGEALQEADRRKDEFLATLAHELRNPLAPLRTGLEVLKRAPTSAREERIVGVMERQLAHMVRLVNDLLDVSRISRGRVELKKASVPLRAVLEDALETSRPLVDARSQELVTSLPEPSLVVDADRTRLAQVVGNLLNNAAKFTPEGRRIRLAAWREGQDAVIQVADEGVGIPPDLLPRVFELFTQGGRSLDPAEGGLGIGLSLVRRLVELHGGTVQAESEGAGKGSTFTVRIPAAASPPAEARPGEEALRPSTPPPLRVLVVDDNVDGAATLAELVALSGHAVRTAHEGTGALVSFREFHPDVVFLDIGLPGISGYEVARRMREDHAPERALLVALTGWGGQDDRRRSREAGFDVHLTKPVAWEDVERVLDRVGQERRGPTGAPPHRLPSPGAA